MEPTREPMVVLLPSVLTGPASWRGVERALTAGGSRVVVADPGPARRAEDVLAAYAAATEVPAGGGRGPGPVRLVAHSNAGLYLPALLDLVEASSVVLVDAALPGSAGTTSLAPPALRARLHDLADADGLLPAWSHWWPENEVARLFPDQAAHDAFTASEPRLPLSYFEGRLPVPSGWTTRPTAYLAFGDTYAAEVATAQRYGWPVSTLPGGHLHLLHDPVGVAAELLRMARLVEGRPARS